MIRRLGQRIQNYPIRFKLLGSYLIVVLIFAISVAIIYTKVRQVLLDNIQGDLKKSNAMLISLVKVSAETSIRNYLRAVAEKNRDMVDYYYREYLGGRLTEPEAKNRASAMLLSQVIGATGYLYCLDSQGVLQVHPKEALRGADISSYAFVQEQIQRKEGYLEYDWQNPGESAPRAKALYMVYFAPWDWIISASSYRGEFTSLVNVQDFRDHFLAVRFGETGYPYVINGQGVLIIHPKQEGVNILDSKDASGRFFIQEMIAQKNGEITYPWQNPDEAARRDKIVYFGYIPEMDWIVATSGYVEEIYSPLNVILLTIVVTFLLALALILALTFLVSPFITRPLNALMVGFARGEKGDLAVRVDETSTDEVGQLGQYFNAFMSRLQIYQEHLEDMVKERTLQLEENEKTFRSLFELSPIGMVVTSLEGEFLRANDAFCRLLGYSGEELLKSIFSYDAFLDEAENRAAQEQRERLLHGEIDHIEQEKQFTRRDGQTLSTILNTIVERDLEDNPLHYIIQVVDITDRKRAEVELRAAKETAEAATQSKSEFLANMSHEIRTPMNAIIGMTSLMLDTPLKPEQRHFAEVVRSSSDTLLTLINDILDFSKIEAGKLEMESIPFDLRTCIEETLDLISVRASQKRLELAYQIEPAAPSHIVGDVTRLRQILVNLLNNAVKFTDQGEVVVTVETERPDGMSLAGASMDGFAPGAQVYRLHFKVRDTGIGIPPDKIGSLFHSFSQVDASTTRKYGGTGLGLAISKRLCEMMGGKMWVESTGILGQGSTFHFTVVVESREDRRAPVYGIDQPDLAGRHVLIVDDNETNRLIMSHYLQGMKMDVAAAGSGPEALNLMSGREGQPDQFELALLDMQMPGMDGVMLAKEIRSRPALRSIPLVMVTSLGYGKAEDTAGLFNNYLHKPLKPSQLYDAVLEVFTGQKAATPDKRASDLKFDPQMASLHPLRILLAEDNAVNQQVATRFLQRIGYRADIAANGLEALSSLRRQPYDVVLMDVHMPEMDGLEASRCIVQEWPEASRPRLIAMTANAMQGDREMCFAAGMEDYVSKPINMYELVRALGAALPLKDLAAAAAPAGDTRDKLGVNAHSVNAHSANALSQETSSPESAFLESGFMRGAFMEDAPLEGGSPAVENMPESEVFPAVDGKVAWGGDATEGDATAGSKAAVDVAILATLAEMIGDEMMPDLLQTFLADSQTQLADLVTAFAAQDVKVFERVAHTLKSSCAMLGAMALSGLYREMERLGKAGDISGAGGLLEKAGKEDARMRADMAKLT